MKENNEIDSRLILFMESTEIILTEVGGDVARLCGVDTDG